MLLSTYCDPPLSWTSQWQQLQELYVSSCAALHLKPNSRAIAHFHELARDHASPSSITSIDASSFFLGRRGVLPLLTVVRQCTSLQSLCLAESGIDDFSCHAICAALSEHPNLRSLDLRGNYFTGESLDFLHRLGNSWLTSDEQIRAEMTPRGVSIFVSEAFGISSASCSLLRNWVLTRRESNWGYSASNRSKVSLLSKRLEAHSPKHTAQFFADLQKTKQRISLSEFFLDRVPRGKIQFTSERWLIVSVFISSSFTDCIDESNLIHRIIFPRANWKLRQFRVHLVPVMLHSTLEEFHQPAATVEADGREPIDYTRLPSYRKGRRAFEEDRTGRRHGLLFTEEGAHSSEVRALMIRNCDAFVGLYSDMFDKSIHLSDFEVARRLAIPTMGFRRKISGLPVELTHLHDYKRSLEMSHAASNSNLSGRSFGVRSRSDIEEDMDAELNGFDSFLANVKTHCGVAFTEYDAPYSRSYIGGERRFDIDEDFVHNFIISLVSLGHAYLAKRDGGSSPGAPVFDPTEADVARSRKVPRIPCQNWGCEPAASDFVKSIVESVVAPFKSEEEILRQKHGIDASVPQRSHARIDSQENNGSTHVACVTERPFCAILGEAGTGKTTQLRAIAATISQDSLASIAKFSVIHGKATLLSTMIGILQQFYRRFSEAGGSVFHQFLDPNASEAELVQGFCTALRNAPMINEFSNRIVFFIDDDDFASKSFVELFLRNPDYYKLLLDSTPSSECKVQFFFTTRACSREGIHEDLLSVFEVPAFSEVEAADLFHYLTIGTSLSHSSVSERAKEAGRRIAFTKRHGTRPLYIYLAAREVAYYLENTPISAIVEVLPETVEELAETAMKVALPPDLECFFEAVATAPEPFTGAMHRFAMRAYRQYPYFSEASSEKYRWKTPRTWGRITEPIPSSAGVISICNANFCHLFEHCSRETGHGFLTHRWSSAKTNIWRTPLCFAHRTVLSASRRIFDSPRSHSSIFRQVWERPLKRMAYIRESPFSIKALSNLPDPGFFFNSAQRPFSMIAEKAFDELIVLMQEMVLQSEVSEAGMPAVFAFAEYCRQNWFVLRRHRAYFFARPDDIPVTLLPILLAAFKNNPCARLEVTGAYNLGRGSDSNASVSIRASPCSSACIWFFSPSVRPHDVTPATVASATCATYGKVFVQQLHCPAIDYRPHQNAICSGELMVDSYGIRIVTAAFLESKFVLASVVNGEAVVMGVVSLDSIPKSSIRMTLSSWNGATLEGADHEKSFPMLAYADKNVLVVVERHSERSAPRSHRFEGHDATISLCGFSTAGCKVFSIDVSGKCILWGAPEGPFNGTILAVTTLNCLPQGARMISSTALLYFSPEGVYTWDSETSYVCDLSPALTKKDPNVDRYSVYFTSDSCTPDGLGFVEADTRTLQWSAFDTDAWCFPKPTEFMLIQDHVSTIDSVGNVDVALWRWRFSSTFAVGYDTREHMLKAFCRRSRRQLPLFFAVPGRVVGANGGVPVFRNLSEFVFVGSDHLVVSDVEGYVYCLRILRGPMVYPSDPVSLD